MKHPLFGKLMALIGVVLVLVIGLGAVSGIVGERQRRQLEADQTVAGSLAGAQTLVGPALQRHCQESWTRIDGEDKERKSTTEHRDFTQILWPHTLAMTTRASIEPRYRGLFKVNGFLTQSTITATWTDTSPPVPSADLVGGRLRCDAPALAIALTDARGIRSATVTVDGARLPVLPGSAMAANPRGLHAVVTEDGPHTQPLRAEIVLALAGTGSVAWTPVGDESEVRASAGWPHPSFAGRFLPVSRVVTEDGFEATWQISSLATTAQQALRDGASACALTDVGEIMMASAPMERQACVDTFGVRFIDPVDGYVLNDRAIKYGLLFIGLTFVGVALVEVLYRLRVHPVQYLLVGCALTVFFLLLLSLSEHVGFALAYVAASAACTALLTFYGVYVLRGIKPGFAFGATIAGLYGALYAILQLEQTALLLGSTVLFVTLSAVMFATRRIDWYALSAKLRTDKVPV